MSKRKNPYQETESPTKKRKLAPSPTSNWCIKLTSTQNATAAESLFSISNEKSFKVGRDSSCCSVLFSNTPMISRIHCQFIYNNTKNQLFIKDLKSTNGVFVNNNKIDTNNSPKQLFTNDIIRFGKIYKNFNHSYKIQIISNNSNNNSNTNNNTNNSNINCNNLMNIEAILKRTVEKQLAAHSKQMEEKILAKEEENKRMKQILYEKEMKELAEKAAKQEQELENKQKEVEQMKQKIENEKLKSAQKLKMEKLKIQKEKENALKLAKIKQKQELEKIKKKENQAMKQEMEAQKKLKAIAEAEKKFEEQKKKQELENK
eukprot:550093_1